MAKDTGIEIVDENSSIEFISDDDDKKNYTDIYNALIRHPQITPEDFRVYVVIKSYTWGNGSWNLKINALIEQSGVKRTTLFACLKWLELNGFLKRIERRTSKNERLPSTYIVKKLNSETGLPVGVTSIEKRKPSLKKKGGNNNCGKTCGNPVDNSVNNLRNNQNSTKGSSAGELGVVQQANLGSSADELGVVQQPNRLNTIVNINTIVNKDDREKDDSTPPFSSLSISDTWEEVKKLLLEKGMTDVAIGSWINPLKPVAIKDGIMHLVTDQPLQKQFAEAKFKPVIDKALEKLELNGFKVTLKEAV